MAGTASTVRWASGLREVARLYRGVVFDLGLIAGSAAPPRQAALLARCARALLEGDKRVALVGGIPARASAVASAAKSAGLPDGIATWSSGEFVHRGFASGTTPCSELLRTALPMLPTDRPPKIFEMSSIAKPRRWAEFMARGPPLADLGKAGAIKRIDDLEAADLCYWDAAEGDEIMEAEATLELCAHSRVPLVHVRRGTAVARALEGSHGRGSPEAAAAALERLGGKAVGLGKLQGFADGIGWLNDMSPQDILLVSGDLGDVLEASEAGFGSMLLFTGQVHSQLSAFRSNQEQDQAAQRKGMSVSQRVAADSPGMLHAASNPFLSVFQLPSILAEATRKNAEHRAAKVATEAKAQKQAVDANIREDESRSRKSSAKPPQPQPTASAEELAAQLDRWCRSCGARSPIAALAELPLRWDVDEAEDDAVARGPPAEASGAGRMGRGSRRTLAGGPGTAELQRDEEPWTGGTSLPDPLAGARGRPAGKDAESLDDILGALKR